MPPVILVLDLGSSRLRCALVPVDGGNPPLEVSHAPYPMTNERAGTLAHAYNPRLLRERLLRVLAQGAQAAGPRNVAAVAVTAQRLATCFFDADLATLSAGANNDTRAVFQGGAMDDAHGSLIHRTTGHLPSMLFAPAKYAWWRESRPRTARRIAKTAGLDAWAALQLTGTLAETRLGLGEAGLLDVTSGKPARGVTGTARRTAEPAAGRAASGRPGGAADGRGSRGDGPAEHDARSSRGAGLAGGHGRLRRGDGWGDSLRRRVERTGAGDDGVASVRPAGADMDVAARGQREVDERGDTG